MSDRERTDAGTFAETVTLDDVLGVFDQVRGPVITSSDVSDALDCSTEAARQKLSRLDDQNKVDHRKTGRTTVYWRTQGESDGTRAAQDSRDQDDTAPPNPTSASDAVADALGGWSHGRNEAEQEASRQIAEAATEWLRDSGVTARKMHVPLDDLADTDPRGRSPDTLWTQVVRPAWDHAAEKDGPVTKPSPRKYTWNVEE